MRSRMCPPQKDLFLASGSPRRQEMVAGLGLKSDARALDVDETTRPGESPREYVARVSRLKLEAGLSFAAAAECHFHSVLAADTVVVLDDEILGKPRDDHEGLAMLSGLAGRAHQVLSSYVLASTTQSARVIQRTVCTDVHFRAADSDELARYVATGEGRDKAGSYAIQGIGAFLVQGISGSYSNVVGLPLCELILDLKELGILRDYP